jgi:hypothetical protein
VKTDIEYLELLEKDLARAAVQEEALAAPTARRRRREWNWGTWVAAAIPILVVAGLIGWLATGGGLGGDEQAGSGGGAGGEAPAAPSATTAPADQREVLDFGGDGGGDAEAAVPGPAPTGSQDDLSKIIRNGQIAIVVPDDGFGRGFASVTRIATNNGGFVLSSSIRERRAGTLVLRIPARRFDEAMLALRELGDVERQQITGRDVTAEFVDLQARLRIAKARRTVLLRLMTSADTIPEILQVQNHLDDVQLRIEQIEGQLRFINDQVAEARVRVSLREKDATSAQRRDEVENPSLGTALDRAIAGFVGVVAAVVVGLGYLIPVGALALVVGGVTAALRRRRAAS